MPRGVIRILFTNWIDEDNFNAQSLNVREVALHLDPERFHSTLFYRRTPDPRLLNRPSIELIRVPGRWGTLKMLSTAMKGHQILFRANVIRFTYLYLHLPEKLRRGMTIVDWLEGYDRHAYGEASSRWLKYSNFIQPRVKHRIAMTEYVARKHLEDLGVHSEGIIPVGVNTRVFAPPLQRSNRTPTVLFVGTLVPRKNPFAVLAAARRFPSAQFIVIGEKRGSYHLRLHTLVNKWKSGNVTFLDPMPQAELVKWMHRSDILLHPSRCEGFPKAVLEAAATGLPAVVCDRYEAPAVVNNITGFQVKTSRQMMERLGMLIEDPSLRQRMGADAVDHALKFDWDVVVKRWEEVFQRLSAA